MIAAIDGVGAKHGGAASVLLEAVGAALRRADFEQVVVFCAPAKLRRFEFPQQPRLRLVEAPLGEAGPIGRVLWHEVGLRRAVREWRAQVVLLLGGGGWVGPGVATVNLIQQSLPFLPEALSTLGLKYRVRMFVLREAMRRSCRRARRVVVQTRVMQAAVAAVLDVAPERVAVVEPAPAQVLPTASAPALEAMRSAPTGARLLYVGNDSAYKNLATLREGLKLLRTTHPQVMLFATLPPKHPLTGQPGVVGLGYLPASALAEALGLASALVMPSLAETVGLPLVEAAQAGLPVLAADRPYAREVCGEAALYFDPLAPSDLAEKAATLLADADLRANLAERGRANAARRTAAAPYDRLMELLADAGRGPSME